MTHFKKNIHLIILLPVLLTVACSKLLESQIIERETIEKYLGNPETAEANFEHLISTCYNVFYMSEGSWGEHNHTGEWMTGDWLSDDCEKGGDGPGDFPEVLEWRTWSVVPSEYNHENNAWRQSYLGISRANAVLEYVETYAENLSGDAYNRIKGEALFIRAYFYFYLAKVYGSVPYFDSPLTPNQYMAPVKESPEELYALIEGDLLLAAQLVPEKSAWQNIGIDPRGRAPRGAINAILARVISMEIGFGFNNKTWQDVYNVTNSIINSGEYALHTNYAVIFETGGEHNSESVLEIDCNDYGQMYGEPGGNSQPVFVQYRPDFMLNFGKRLVFAGTFGWGFSCPSRNLYEEFEQGDIRRECTIIANGSVLWDDGYPFTDERINVVESTVCPTGFWFRKYAYSLEEMPTNNTSSGKNMRLCRYAEVLLLHAEAAYHTGRASEAMQYLSEVRDRARNSTPPKGSEWGNAGYPEAPRTLGPITSTYGEALLRAIKHERRVELAIEGNRAWDLIRWGEYEDAIRRYIPEDHVLYTVDPEQVIANYRSHLIDGIVPCLPIPPDEVEAFDIEQNPGY